MFIGREKELALLESLYASDTFEYLVLYGRRRVGKTSLLLEFSRNHPVIFYAAQAKNDSLNLSDFSKAVQQYFSGSSFGTFSDWQTALKFISSQPSEQRITLIIDEFPFIAESNESIKSILQHTIDHDWKHKNIFLLLCGSSVSFMASDVMGARSPLYGRSTSNLELTGFDYLESSSFFPDYTYEDKLLSYGILGGIPCYLAAFSDKVSIEQNIAGSILRMGSFLQYETQNLLKMELREPSVYNSIFEAIATGSSRLNDIAMKVHEPQTKCAKYIRVLKEMKLIDKVTPSGEKDSSRKTIYQIADNFFLFWFHFIFANKSYFDLLGEQNAAREIVGHLPEYMGHVFEKVCTEYLIRQARLGKLPFVPHSMGRWWGGNPRTRKQEAIDILAFDSSRESAIFCECKFRTRVFATDEYQAFLDAAAIIRKPVNRWYYLFSKSGFTEAVQERAQQDGVVLIGMEELFRVADG